MNKPSIPQPCNEDWNAMTPRDKGRYCNSCAKVVVDFTTMNDAEIVNYLQQHSKQKTCGHFRNEQLHQTEKIEINLASIPNNLSFRNYFAIALVIVFSSFGLVSCKSHIDEPVGMVAFDDSTQIIHNQTIDSNSVDGEIAPLKNDSKIVKPNITTTIIVTTSNTVGEIKEVPVLDTAQVRYEMNKYKVNDSIKPTQ